ncbi:MAG: hypothetical protein WAN16_03055 [Chthoniobacterales bacterium]
MSGEHKVKAVLNIGGEISSTLKGSLNLLTGNISKIGTLANKSIKGQLGAAIASANKEAKSLTNEIRRTGDASGNLKMKLDAVSASLQRAKGLSSLYHSTGDAIGKFARGMAVVTAEATVAGWAIFHLTEKYQDHVLAMRAGGKVLSLTTQSYTALHSAAGKFADVTENAFKLFQGNVMGGNKKTLSALAAIGIDPNSLKGTTNLEAFLRVADKLKAAADKGQSVTGVARSLMGRGGADALPFLLRGRKEIERMMKEARDMGVVPSKEDEANAIEDAKVMASLERAMLGMKLSVGRAFQPVMDTLGLTISRFMVEHGPEFRKVMDELGAVIEKSIPTVEQLKGAMDSLGSAIKWAGEHTTAMKFILGAIVVMPFLPFLASLAQIALALKGLGGAAVLQGIGSATKGLWGLAAANAPILLTVATIATLTAGVIALGAAFYEIHKNWDVWGSMDSWKGMGKNILGMGPSNDPAAIQAEVDAMRKSRGGAKGAGPSPDPSSLFRSASPAASATRNYNPVFHFNVTAAPGMDAHSVADMVMNKLDGRMNAMASGALFD